MGLEPTTFSLAPHLLTSIYMILLELILSKIPENYQRRRLRRHFPQTTFRLPQPPPFLKNPPQADKTCKILGVLV